MFTPPASLLQRRFKWYLPRSSREGIADKLILGGGKVNLAQPGLWDMIFLLAWVCFIFLIFNLPASSNLSANKPAKTGDSVQPTRVPTDTWFHLLSREQSSYLWIIILHAQRFILYVHTISASKRQDRLKVLNCNGKHKSTFTKVLKTDSLP